MGFNMVWRRGQEDNLWLASCVLNWEIRTLFPGLSEPGFFHSSSSISQGYVGDSACILLCTDSWQDFKRPQLLVLGSSMVFMAGLACKKSYAFKGYFGDFLPPVVEILQEYLGQFLFQTWLIVKQTMSLNPSDSFQFVCELRRIHIHVSKLLQSN